MKKLTYYWICLKGDKPATIDCRTVAKTKKLIRSGRVYSVTRVIKTKSKSSMEKIYRDSEQYPLNRIKA